MPSRIPADPEMEKAAPRTIRASWQRCRQRRRPRARSSRLPSRLSPRSGAPRRRLRRLRAWPPRSRLPSSSRCPIAPSRRPPAAKQRVARMPRDRASMARDLQLELRRVGCYGGELNGIWTAATRKAMKAFTDRVNATLPVEVPDEILLTLVQAHQGEACGKPCPPGQGLSDDGRCLPGAILAQAAKKGTSHSAMAARQNAGQPAEKPTAAIAPWTATTAAAIPAPLPGPRPVGRMALAGPTIATPPLAAESPPGSPVPAALSPSKQAGPRARAAGQVARAAAAVRAGCLRPPQRLRGVRAVQQAFYVLTASGGASLAPRPSARPWRSGAPRIGRGSPSAP